MLHAESIEPSAAGDAGRPRAGHARPNLGHPAGRVRGPDRQRLADPSVHRPRGAVQVRPARGYRPEPGELRFDMFEAEYTHEGERCTFQTLVARFGLRDRPSPPSARSSTTSIARTSSSAGPRPRASPGCCAASPTRRRGRRAARAGRAPVRRSLRRLRPVRVPLRAWVAYFLRLGTFGFGGPIALVGGDAAGPGRAAGLDHRRRV